MPDKLHAAADVADLLHALDGLSASLEPLDASAMDGFLAGIALARTPLERVWRRLIDPEDRSPTIGPQEPSVQRVLNVLQSRRGALDRAIAQRTWFDPWVFEPETPSLESVHEACAPWAAGFAMAMELMPDTLGGQPGQEADWAEALALIYVHFDADDLEDADEVLAAIEAMEPALDMAAAVEDLVTATLLLADILRPQAATRAAPSKRATNRSGAKGRRRRRS